MKNVVVVGAGHAGVELVASLRENGFAGRIDLLSDEPDLPYQRPPLSKEYIKKSTSAPLLRPAQFYADNDVRLHAGIAATAIQRDARRLLLSDGSSLGYDHLVFATGARNRLLGLPGIDRPQVYQMRTLADVRRVITGLPGWKHVTIIGGGFIGLEAAGLLSTMGAKVALIELAPRLMQRSVSPTVSQWFLNHHQAQGVEFHMERHVTSIEEASSGVKVRLSDGIGIATDAVIMAAGVIPNTELASDARLHTDNGIVVDSRLSTADVAISALGDCASYPNVFAGGRTRLESVQNATDQARFLAARLCGRAGTYSALPWFWSIQGAARLQIAGLGEAGLTEIVRGDPASGKFSVFLFDGDRLKAVESVNSVADHMASRRLLGMPQECRLTPGQARDAECSLKDLVSLVHQAA